MEIKIFNNILFGSLKPWLIDAGSTKLFAENLKHAGSKIAITEFELVQQLKTLLQGKADLIAWLNQQPADKNMVLLEPYYFTDLPAFNDTLSKYYSQVIGLEAKRVFNRFKAYSETLDNQIDIIYNTNILLSSIKTLLKQTIEEIEDRGFEEKSDKSNSLVPFTLQYLKHNLTVLFLSIQAINEEHLEQIFTPEDFHLLELEQPLSTMQEIHFMLPDPIEQTQSKSKPKKLTFGYKGDEARLKKVIIELTNQIQLVDRTFSKAEDLSNLLISKNIVPNTPVIHIGCETTQFRFILEKLKLHFHNLTFSTVGNSSLFKSKNDTIISSQLLFSSKLANYKNEDEITEIIAKLK
ncbi:DUF6617 family protein [Limnovirga soli]|uniref:Uncharacterized protein n=1 Tax=Limnovirga soli TaxID=2656915 RepID=A0A8J8FH63_9BACT|nr:DUF6617 family protein [Limnovirga soli]NNV57808.1 hypothetical protein [Limnovirga soli]